MNRKFCRGCQDDFYNGNNSIGVQQCWSFKDAKLVWRIPVGHWENPPYKNKQKVRVASCWHGDGPNRTHYISQDALDKDGYWKSRKTDPPANGAKVVSEASTQF